MQKFGFRTVHQDRTSHARVGEIQTPHGVIQTPAFVPVGTQATVKSLTPDELTDLDVGLFFVNTYHAYLRPGLDVIKKFGGLHQFMHWDKPLITDSGGFQVFSLARDKFANKNYSSSDESSRSREVSRNSSRRSSPREFSPRGSNNNREDEKPSLVKISEDGVEFRSHWDGTKHLFTPESSMEYQWILGADIHIAFDDCTPYGVSKEKARASMERTYRWALRSKVANDTCQMTHAKLGKPYQALYGVVQGSVFEDLRKESAMAIRSMDFDGIAIGGVSVGESKEEMVRVLDWTVPLLPDDKPRHLLGVGEIDDIFALVERGIDTFDCVQPTRLARAGYVLIGNNPIIKLSNNPINKYKIDITKAIYADDIRPIDAQCTCYTCQNFSRAYLHHLFHVKELLGYRLATIHNVHFISTLMSDIRKAIGEGVLLELKKQWVYT